MLTLPLNEQPPNADQLALFGHAVPLHTLTTDYSPLHSYNEADEGGGFDYRSLPDLFLGGKDQVP